MSIGIIGKENGVRWVTGSIHYGKLPTERQNLERGKTWDRFNGRSVLTIGYNAVKLFKVAPPKVKKTRSKSK